jgi:recombination protein RecA
MGFADVIKAVSTKMSPANADLIFDPNRELEVISSGIFVFDLITGVGGFPKRRIVELFGMEHSGKTSLLLATHAKLQREGRCSVLYDYEHAFDVNFARDTFGLVQDGKTFVVIQPNSVEEGLVSFLEIMALLEKEEKAIKSARGKEKKKLEKKRTRIELFSHDSVDAMKPRAIIDGDIEKNEQPGLHARAMGKAITQLRTYAKRWNFAVVFINQMRSQIKMGSEQSPGTGAGFNVRESFTTPGGHALRFYSSIRMKLRYAGKLEEKKDTSGMLEQGKRYGQRVEIVNVKNKVSTPFLKGVTHFLFPSAKHSGGFSEVHDVIDLLTKAKRIAVSGQTIVYKGLNIPEWSCSGTKDEIGEQFVANVEVMKDAKALIHSMLGKRKTLADLANVKQIEGMEDIKDVKEEEAAQDTINLSEIVGSE